MAKSEQVRQETLCGFLNVYKPQGMTSHDVVAKVRKLFGIKQVGHGGTLDPLAEGVLPVAIGKACRLIRFLDTDKIYLAEIMLGLKTTTDDLEGEVVESLISAKDYKADGRDNLDNLDNLDSPDSLDNPDTRHSTDKPAKPIPDQNAIKQALNLFTGTFDQIPPLYSAIHYEGKRLYELARNGQLPAEIKPRQVHVSKLELITVEGPVVRVRVNCAGGTYIRSIARDLGDHLALGGCLKSLIREASGSFTIANAHRLEDLSQNKSRTDLAACILKPLPFLMEQPRALVLQIDEAIEQRVIQGQKLPPDAFNLKDDLNQQLADKDILVARGQRLIAVCAFEDELIKPKVVLGA